MPEQKVIKALPVIIERLQATYPNARYELDWTKPLELLVATILAAQCTDERVNQVTPALFKKYPSARAYAEADLTDLENDLRPTGFYRQKAKTVQEVCRVLVEKHDGEVPVTMEEMVELPGVARKTANVVLNNAFQLPTGVIVDTHVQRVSQRMGLTDQTKPEKIEIDLMRIVPKDRWIFFGPAMVLLGRYTCTFHAPKCGECIMKDLCPKLGVGENEEPTGEDSLNPDEETPAMATKKTKPTKKAPASKAKATPAPAKNGTSVPSLRDQLPPDWQAALQGEFDKPYFKALEKFVASERQKNTVYPPEADMFAAFKATPFDQVRVLLLGQDPYHGDGEAHGMCFSVLPGVKVPPSLVNIYKELQQDLGHKPPPHGYLISWANQGVLLLNAVLTVRANEAASHKEQGWETFTDAVIRALNARAKPMVFLLWGAYAQKKAELIDAKKHRVLPSGHPSPLSAKKFFGSKPFSGANFALQELGQQPINWLVPENATELAKPQASTAVPLTPAPVAPPPIVPAPSPAPKPSAAVAAVIGSILPTGIVSAPAREEACRLEMLLPADWREALASEVRKPTFRNLDKYLAGERKDALITPDESEVFAAYRLAPLRSVKVVIVGHEPQNYEGVADGLAFSVREGVDPAEASMTMFRELRRDLGCRIPVTGSLAAWARQGVLLLNLLLTTRVGKPLAHKDRGWEAFTEGTLNLLNAGKQPIVFVLLGIAAGKKRTLIDEDRHVVLTGEHPGISPDKFVGSGLFSEINKALEMKGRSGVYWQLPYA